MILVFGGAYQGKLKYALDTFKSSKNDVLFIDSETESLTTDKKIIYGLEVLTYELSKNGVDVETYFDESLKILSDKIIICNDISQGVVPMDDVERLWRENNGRAMNKISQMATEVHRVFCGIGERIK